MVSSGEAKLKYFYAKINLMSRRFLKQLIYGSVYLALLAGFIYATYLFIILRQPPSCFDNRKNKPTSNYYATDLELEPETKEEIELELKDQENIVAEIKEKFICLEQLKIDKIDRKSFKVWKLIQVIMNEKDEKELIKILTEHIKT